MESYFLMAPGDRMDAEDTAVVAVRPEPRLLHGQLSTDEFEAARSWIGLNAELVGRLAKRR